MEAKKLGLVLGISTIVAAFTMILHLLEAPQVQHPSPLLLNLTSCHESMRRSDLPVYCSDLPGTLELPPHNTLNKIKIRDVLSITKLRCSYEKVNFPWLNNRHRPSVPLDVARVIRVAMEANLETLRKKTDLKLGISELSEDLEADGDDSIWVTLVPRSKGCINATVDGLRIKYIR
ncbi:AUREUSIDIN SYNTHASE-LIKE [Salix koriyanagi]|uniref:AUREUSIDIN SYNTHASE-LIKE n=1 Tax=Salix koriyanagi TaxID=2511006 RepID=A0A9Q0ZLR6_9ROSI|nr:AUREUSIDIN SYNTHASE-LIKE [Salix koriyanagi]